MKNNLISILITNYNKENFLKRCLDSVSKQNFKTCTNHEHRQVQKHPKRNFKAQGTISKTQAPECRKKTPGYTRKALITPSQLSI